MKSEPANSQQANFLYANLLGQLNPKHPLLQLAKAIPWDYFEKALSVHYSYRGKPAKPI